MHLAKIRSRLPRRLCEFVDRFSLHDDCLASLSVIPDLPSGRDALVSVYLYRTGSVAAVALLVLHFVGLRGALKQLPLPSEIMYFDVEEIRGGVLRMGFMMDGHRSWHVTFRDFDFSVHEYEQRA